MPDTEEKTVDIDTTGPGAEVNIYCFFFYVWHSSSYG